MCLFKGHRDISFPRQSEIAMTNGEFAVGLNAALVVVIARAVVASICICSETNVARHCLFTITISPIDITSNFSIYFTQNHFE